MSDYSNDPFAPISKLDHPVAELVRNYLARKAEWAIDDWFLQRAGTYYQDQDADVDKAFSLENLTYPLGSAAPRKVRFLSIRPYYFRGFQQLESPINLNADLVTVYGRNSSGKTSLAEAIEWILTERIKRREEGHPTEFANFVVNRFRPEGQKTWVECDLTVDGETTKIKRVLIDDYGSKKNLRCSSRLFIDGKEIESSIDLLDEYFAGVAPLLMQHTLREFVADLPDKRPRYFEKLLNINEISDLIEDAQVSNLRQSDFPRPGGGKALSDWQQFSESIGENHFKTMVQYSKLDGNSLREAICGALIQVAVDEFDARCESDIESCITVMNSLQERELQRRFPSLQSFQPKENLSEATFSKYSVDSQYDSLQSLVKARTDYLKAIESQKVISEAKVSIAKALGILREAELIRDEDPQTCPVCEYQPVPTLTQSRIAEIDSWNPIRELVEQTKDDFEEAIKGGCKTIEDLQSLRRNLVPSNLPEHSVQDIGEIANSDSFKALLAAHTDAKQKLQTFDDSMSVALAELKKVDPELSVHEILRDAFSLVPTLQRCAEAYARNYGTFQGYLNQLATHNQDYKARDSWLKIARNRDELILDFQWKAAKDRSREELVVCRNLLIDARLKYLEPRRKSFSDGIDNIWSKLRRDDYSAFSRLLIPEPTGKGMKTRIEVKAELTKSKSEKHEVHALSVLSESQINAIGIAAFVTRSALLRHNVLVFDDPVQSMDDAHFNSFADEVLSHLCDYGLQVIVLTHNDDFDQGMNYFHSDHENRISMEITHTGNNGISVTEGNRSVSGLLNMGHTYWGDGEYKTAWTHLRYAIERLYMLIRIKHGQQPFKWRTWKRFTAGQMWNPSVKNLLLPRFPDIARRMHHIVGMTAGGAHNRQAHGYTDYQMAVEVIRDLQCKTEVGD